MFVITQHQPANSDEFLQQVQTMTEQLSKEPGFIRLSVTRSVDEPNNWKIVQEWEQIGDARRAVNSSKNRMIVWPVLSQAQNEVTFYETLVDYKDGKSFTFESGLSQS
ncbi:MAG: antibiotic biosynthesis monooxygenase family protein [Candidatus Nanopelagicales bacterium]|jgi:heme-degrading monooxygenase HmoA